MMLDDTPVGDHNIHPCSRSTFVLASSDAEPRSASRSAWCRRGQGHDVRVQDSKTVRRIAASSATTSHSQRDSTPTDAVAPVAGSIIDAETALLKAETALDVAEGQAALLDATMALLRARARAAGVMPCLSAPASAAVAAARVAHETVAYYSEDHLPPNTSVRAWRRALRAGVPTARIGNKKVVMVADWNVYVRSLVRRNGRIGTAASDDDLLASVGARPRGKR